MDGLGYPEAPWHKKFTSSGEQISKPSKYGDLKSLKKPSHKRLLATISIGAVLVLFIVYLIIGNGTKSSSSKASTAKINHSPKPTTSQAVSTATKPYTSTNFNLSLNYPVGWSVVDNGTGPMTVTSPAMSLTSATGGKLVGLVTLTVQKQGQIPAGFNTGTNLAVLDSQSISYSNPTANQDSQSYLSFVQYSTTNVKGGLDALYLTGNYGYQKAQTIPTSDIASLNPLITVSFSKCGNSACNKNLTPLTIASSSWSDQALQKPITSMLTSLAFQ